MQTYFSTFVSGAEKIIERAVRKRVDIEALFDGLMVYRSSYTERDIRQIRFFNNSYVFLDSVEGLHENRDPTEAFLKYLARSKRWQKPLRRFFQNTHVSYKLVVTHENRTAAVERKMLLRLEQAIERKNKSLSLNVKHPDYELWAIVRRDGLGLFGIRVTYPFSKKDKAKKGELRYELAHILTLASKPGPKDVVLDPFAGYGGIVIERAKGFPYARIVAVEKDVNMAKQLRSIAKKEKKKVEVIAGDGLDMKEIEDESIDKIITDPPWGLYEELEKEPAVWYQQMLRECMRVLKKKGRMVVLMGNVVDFEKALAKAVGSVVVREKHNILVSGKKATIYLLSKA